MISKWQKGGPTLEKCPNGHVERMLYRPNTDDVKRKCPRCGEIFH